MPQDEFTIEQLIEAAKIKDQFPESKVEQRLLKDIDDFVKELNINHGTTKIHNLVIYSVFKQWGKSTLTLREFKEAFAYFYPEHRDSRNNICFKLTKKYTGGKFDTSANNIKLCRSLYGKKTISTVTPKIPGAESESESNQS